MSYADEYRAAMAAERDPRLPKLESKPDYAAEYRAAMSQQAPTGPKQYTRYSGPNDDPDLPARARTTRLKRAPSMDAAAIGFKENDEDREAAAREMYPDSRVYRDNEGTVTVSRPDGTVYNFEKPDFGQAIAGAVRGVFDLRNSGTRWGGRDDDVREGTSGDMIRQNADAALPNIVTRGAANVAAGALTGGASVVGPALAYGAANAGVPALNSLINKYTAGGSSQSNEDVAIDSAIDGAIGAGSVLLPAGVGAFARRYTSAGKMNRALEELALEEGRANPELARMLGLTKEALPAEALVNEENALALKTGLADKTAGTVNNRAWNNVDAMEQSAISTRNEAARGIESAVVGKEDANRKVLEETMKLRDRIRDARNTSKIAINEADKAAAEMNARDAATNAANKEAYNQKVAQQGEEYAAQARARAEEVAKLKEADAQAQLRFNQNRAREANQRAMNNNEIDEQITAAKENYAGRYAQNRVAELEAQRPGAVSKVLPPQKSQLPPKVVRDAKPAKPTPVAKEARPIADPYQEPARDELNAARREYSDAKAGVTAAKQGAEEVERQLQPFDQMQKDLRAAAKKVAGANNDKAFTIGKNVVRMGAAYATGGKTLAAEGLYRAGRRMFSGRATLRIMRDPQLMRQAQELAAAGKRLTPQDTSAAEAFQRELEAFMTEVNSD